MSLSLTLFVGFFIFMIMGKDPIHGLQVFLVEPFRSYRAIAELGLKMMPVVLCAIGLCVCFRANVWNIGAEGQFILGGIFAATVVLWFDSSNLKIPSFLVTLLSVCAGIFGGVFWASLTAICKDKFRANEILVSLMLTYVAQFLLIYLCSDSLKDPNGMNFPQSKLFPSEVLLPMLVEGGRLHIGFIVTLILAIVIAAILFKSFIGYQLMVGGAAPDAARYAGFSARGALWLALILSGAMAGLAGAFEVLGPIGQLLPSISPGYGFSAIIVAFVSRLNPIGAIFGGLVLAVFYLGGELAQSRMGLPFAITGIFQGLLLFFLIACDTFIDYRIVRKTP